MNGLQGLKRYNSDLDINIYIHRGKIRKNYHKIQFIYDKYRTSLQ